MDKFESRPKELASLYEARYGAGTTAPRTNFNFQPVTGLLGRRSVRSFEQRPLPEGMLEVLLACAQSAPSKSDLQQYSIIIIDEAEVRSTISERIGSMPWIAEAAVFALFCADMHRHRVMGAEFGLPHANDNVDTFMNAAVDAALAMQAFITAAERLGLGCCPVSVVRNHIDVITELTGLPEGVFPIAGLACGWPATASSTSLRLPQSVVVHYNRYNDRDLVAGVRDYDARRRQREPIAPNKQRHVDRYGVKEELGWSENCARQLSVPERQAFKAYLARQQINLT